MGPISQKEEIPHSYFLKEKKCNHIGLLENFFLISLCINGVNFMTKIGYSAYSFKKYCCGVFVEGIP